MYSAAILGLGDIAWLYDQHQPASKLTHYSAYLASKRVRLFAAADPDPEKRELFERWSGINCVENLDSLLALKPQMVSITSPSQFHAVQLEQCIDAGVPMVWAEKPLGVSAKDSDLLESLPQRCKASTVLVGFQRRYQPAYQRLKELINEGSLGTCIALSIVYSRGLLTNGIHLIDILGYLLGEEAVAECVKLKNSCDSNSPSFLLKLQSGQICTVTGLDIDLHSIDVTAHFTDGRAHVWHGGLSEFREVKAANPQYPGFHVLNFDETHTQTSQQLLQENKGVMSRLLNDLIDAYEQGRQPKSNLTTAIAAQLLVDSVIDRY